MSELDREIYNNWKSAATIPEWWGRFSSKAISFYIG